MLFCFVFAVDQVMTPRGQEMPKSSSLAFQNLSKEAQSPFPLANIKRVLDTNQRYSSQTLFSLTEKITQSIYKGLSPNIEKTFRTPNVIMYFLKNEKCAFVSPGMEWLLLQCKSASMNGLTHAVDKSGNNFWFKDNAFIILFNALPDVYKDIGWQIMPHIVERSPNEDDDYWSVPSSIGPSADNTPERPSLPGSPERREPLYGIMGNESHFLVNHILEVWVELRKRIFVTVPTIVFNDLFPIHTTSPEIVPSSVMTDDKTTYTIFRARNGQGILMIPTTAETVLYDWLGEMRNGKFIDTAILTSASFNPSVWLLEVTPNVYAIISTASMITDLAPLFEMPEGPHMCLSLLLNSDSKVPNLED